MAEIWLRSNRRALALGLILPGVLLITGILLAALTHHFYAQIAGSILAAVGLLGCAALLWQMRLPRLAVDDSRLLVYARSGRPYGVPIEVVEGFLLGQGPSFLPGKRNARTETTNFVIRLAESAADWSQRDMHPALGKWCGSYITIRGTWCERLSVDLVQRLNVRLAEMHARSSGSRP
jgi:hypothetical protein